MKRVAVATAVLLLLAGSALAQNKPAAAPQPGAAPAAPAAGTPGTPPRPGPWTRKNSAGPCMEDLKALCASVKPGEGRKIACLIRQKTALHPACRVRMDQIYKIESDLAARQHITVDELVKESWAEKERQDYVDKLNAQKAKQNAQKVKPGSAPATTNPPASPKSPASGTTPGAKN